MPAITGVDYVAIPTQDAERAKEFYGETLGLRVDADVPSEFWAGDLCLSIWAPTRFGVEFAPQRNGHLALHVEDVAAAQRELEAKGVVFKGPAFDTGVCHMALFSDPDGNDLMLHSRHAPH